MREGLEICSPHPQQRGVVAARDLLGVIWECFGWRCSGQTWLLVTCWSSLLCFGILALNCIVFLT